MRRASGRKRERMRGLVEAWQRSGETASGFAERHGISRFQFQYWRGRFGRVAHRGGKGRAVAFAPVSVIDDRAQGMPADLELRLASGDVVRCGAGLPLDRLLAVVRLLRERC